MYRRLFTGIVLFAIITACGQGKDAQKRLDEARRLYENSQFLAAKNAIDSINILFPREIAVRKQALTLLRIVERGECERNIAYCDSLIPIREGELVHLKKGFVFEKNEPYDVIGKYIWSTMTIERNLERSYIRCGVDEEGEMYMASVYFGSSPLNHTGLRFSLNDGTFAETPSIPYDGGINYRFKDLGNTTEVVTYQRGNCKEIANFILIVNEKERIRATYTGGRAFMLYLSDTDKKAIRATYELANVLSEIHAMRIEKIKSEKKIQLIDARLNNE